MLNSHIARVVAAWSAGAACMLFVGAASFATEASDPAHNGLFWGGQQLWGGSLVGGVANDNIRSGPRADLLVSHGGDDVITGGGGSDGFFLSARPGTTHITDFAPAEDRIILDRVSFSTLRSRPGFGFSDLSDFAVVGTDEDARRDAISGTRFPAVAYSVQSGRLFYRASGVRPGSQGDHVVAILDGAPRISAADFLIVEYESDVVPQVPTPPARGRQGE